MLPLKRQRRLLSIYSTYHEQGGPRLLHRSSRWAILGVILLVAGYVIVAEYFEFPPILTAFVIGVLVGRLLTEFRFYISTRMNWPTLEGVIDWRRVSDALDRGSPEQSRETSLETGICERPRN